jgi:hypothetical protein
LYRPSDYVQVISAVQDEHPDNFDHLIILKTNDLPILIFIESCTSSSAEATMDMVNYVDNKLQNSKTFETILDQASPCKVSGKIFDAIRAKNVIHICTSTQTADSSVIGENCILLGRDVMTAFLNFVWPVYQTVGTEG